jgi:hypothetical protein
MTLSITMLCHRAECHYADCGVLFIIILNVTMRGVIMLNFVMLSVVMLNAAGQTEQKKDKGGFIEHLSLSYVAKQCVIPIITLTRIVYLVTIEAVVAIHGPLFYKPASA